MQQLYHKEKGLHVQIVKQSLLNVYYTFALCELVVCRRSELSCHHKQRYETEEQLKMWDIRFLMIIMIKQSEILMDIYVSK